MALRRIISAVTGAASPASRAAAPTAAPAAAAAASQRAAMLGGLLSSQEQVHRRQPTGTGRQSDAAIIDETLAKLAAVGRSTTASNDAALASSAVHAVLQRPMAELKGSKTAAELAALAQAAYTGAGTTRDVDKASKLWILAAGKGDVASVFNVALCCMDGVGKLPRDPAKAAQLLTPLADVVRHPWAQFVLGTLLLRSRMEDVLRAERAARGGEAGRSSSQSDASALARDGSAAAAAASLPAAASSSAIVPTTSMNLAALPPSQRLHPDCVRAFDYYTTAARAGVAPAWLNLAHCYRLGVGTPEPDARASATWTLHAAKRGDPLAAAEMGALYARGDAAAGVAKDESEALRMFRIAAEGGHPQGMHNVGIAYMAGKHGDKAGSGSSSTAQPDASAALVWFRRAADAGFVPSMVNAGMLLERGVPGASGVPQALPAARAYYSRAATSLMQLLSRPTTATGASSNSIAKALARVNRRIAAVDRKLAATAEIGAPTADRRTSEADTAVASGDDADDGEFEMELQFASREERDAALAQLYSDAASNAGASITAANVLDLVQKHVAPPGAIAKASAPSATAAGDTASRANSAGQEGQPATATEAALRGLRLFMGSRASLKRD